MSQLTTTRVVVPSPEVRALIKQWVALNQQKYGPDWKRLLAQEMTAQMPADVKEFFAVHLNKEVK